MARGINKVILIGNLGNDPEQRAMPNGNAVTNITIATSESWKDKQTGQDQERTEWHRIVFYNRLAEIAGQYLRKGSKVYIEGSLRTRKWQDQGGQDRYTTEIVSNEMQMLGDENKDSSGAPSDATPKNQQSQHPKTQHPKPQHTAQHPQAQHPAQHSPQHSDYEQASGGMASSKKPSGATPQGRPGATPEITLDGFATPRTATLESATPDKYSSVAPPPIDEFDQDVSF